MNDSFDANAIVDKWVKVWDERGTFSADGFDSNAEPDGKQRAYVVSMFPYPSGDLHMGHAEVYSISDAMARFDRMRGKDVLNAIGWDSFGLPAENAAIKRNLHPRDWTYANIEAQAESFRRLGISFDWRTRLHTSDPEYFRWNQWLFLRLFEHGLAYRKAAAVNWCPQDLTVLANEQVIDGHCERCGSEVIQRPLIQWFFRTTAFTQRLLDDMALLDWPEEILAMQRNWIGRSTGAYVDFAVEDGEPLPVFTTRPDTLYGVTFMVVAADSAAARELCAAGQRAALEAYRAETAKANDIERLAANRPKTGVFLGRYALHPLTGERLPLYASDYVLSDYGTGVIMAVPAHDERDLAFAKVFDLPVRTVVQTPADNPTAKGTLINSGPFDGLSGKAAIEGVIAALAESGHGEAAITYRLRDWLLSRQRFWGTPIPIVHCFSCGEVPVPDDHLPLLLPESGYDLRPSDGRSPLATAEEWVDTICPRCGEPAERDTDTMDTFVDSSWYFLRYVSPHYTEGPFDPAAVRRWLPVNDYIGGKEHATGHLMYARFLTKALHDMGMLDFVEPFRRLTTQGQVVMGGKAMSKTLGNLVNLQEQIALHGPDAVRLTMLFAGPPEDDIDWAGVSPTGSVKFLARVWRLASDVGAGTPAGEASDTDLRREVHRMVAEATTLMEGRRFNVAIATLMKLTSTLRKAFDGGDTRGDLREGTEMLVRMLSCFAPFTAEDAWERLGNGPSVSDAGWPVADPKLVARETTTCVIQVNGKIRDRLDVPIEIGEESLLAQALAIPRVAQEVERCTLVRSIVRPPRIVNFVVR